MYNTQAIDIDEAKEISKLYIKTGIIPLLISSPGSGKTSLVKDIAQEMNANLIQLRLNNMAPEEILGLQFIDQENKKTIRFSPKWLPNEDGSDGDTIIFLDELMQAPDEYRKGIMSALLERYLGDKKIPDNCYFIAAGNSSEDGSNVYDLDSATAARFAILKLESNLENWSNGYAKDHNFNLAMMAYLRLRPEHFDIAKTLANNNSENNEDHIIKASPRAWIEASNFLNNAIKENLNPDLIKYGIMGKLGEIITESFWSVYKIIEDNYQLDDMFKMNKQERIKASPKTNDLLWAYGQAMIWKANNKETILKIFGLFDDFVNHENLQLVEIRSHVVETILKNSNLNNINILDDEKIFEYIVQWEKEVNNESIIFNIEKDAA